MTAIESLDRPTGAMELIHDHTVLALPESLTVEDWEGVGRRLSGHERKVQWWIGDWWAFGERCYGSRARIVAENVFGRSYQTLANIASTARKFEPSRRRETLTFTHHAEVAGLPIEEAERILTEAETQGWSVQAVRREAVIAAKTLSGPTAFQFPKAYEPRKFQRVADMIRAGFSDWFGIGDPYASVLMALFAAGGSTITPHDLATNVDSHRPMSTGALHEAISSLRKAMETEAIDTNDQGYCLTEIGLKECRKAIREEASAMAACGLDPDNDWGSGRVA